MKKLIVAAILVVASFAAHADELARAVAAQTKAVSNVQSGSAKAENAPAVSDFIHTQASLLIQEAFATWFQKAQAAGIKFSVVKFSGDAPVTKSAYGGKLVYLNHMCRASGCVYARAQPSGMSEPIDIEISYQGSNDYTDYSRQTAMDNLCVVFGGDTAYNGYCGDLLDKSKRAANIDTMVANLNKYLAKKIGAEAGS